MTRLYVRDRWWLPRIMKLKKPWSPALLPSGFTFRFLHPGRLLQRKQGNSSRPGLLDSCTLCPRASGKVFDEPTCRCHQNPFIGALGIQEPVILREPQIMKPYKWLARKLTNTRGRRWHFRYDFYRRNQDSSEMLVFHCNEQLSQAHERARPLGKISDLLAWLLLSIRFIGTQRTASRKKRQKKSGCASSNETMSH